MKAGEDLSLPNYPFVHTLPPTTHRTTTTMTCLRVNCGQPQFYRKMRVVNRICFELLPLQALALAIRQFPRQLLTSRSVPLLVNSFSSHTRRGLRRGKASLEEFFIPLPHNHLHHFAHLRNRERNEPYAHVRP
jgi:hypothetical protein